MGGSENFFSDIYSIADLFKKQSKFLIPLHQREYEWSTENLDTFWTDLTKHISQHPSEKYFFGTIIVVKPDQHESEYTIIDGQQRITTSLIFLITIRDAIVEEIEDFDNKLNDKTGLNNERLSYLHETIAILKSDLEKLQKILYLNYNKDTQSGDPRLDLNLYNAQFFEDAIFPTKHLSTKISDLKNYSDMKKKDELLRSCYYFFHDKINEIRNEEGLFTTNLRQIFDAFTDAFEFNYIQINELNLGFQIFENINSKGKRLATNNLVKNKLYETFASDYKNDRKKQMEELSDLDDLWQDMVNSIESANHTNASEDKYLKHYLTAFVESTSNTEVYDKITSRYDTPESAKNLIQDLKDKASIFANIVSPQKEDWDNDESVVEDLNSLTLLSDGSLWPIILLYKDSGFDKKAVKKLVNFLVRFFFRVKTICSVNYVHFEPKIGEVCKYLRDNKKSADLNEIFKMMSSNWDKYPENDEFKIKFNKKDFSNSDAKYPLKEIHYHQNGGRDKNAQSVNNSAETEHILPQNITKWIDVIDKQIIKRKKEDDLEQLKEDNPDFTEEEITEKIEAREYVVTKAERDDYQSRYYKKLGNLTLLNTFRNKEIKNFAFDKKKERYGNDTIKMTKDLVDYEIWNDETIEKRQESFTEMALEIWDLKKFLE